MSNSTEITSMMDNPLEFERMAKVERKHWWFKNLHNLVYFVIQSFRFSSPKILDLGCGSGGLMEFLKIKGYNKLIGVDISEFGINYCKQKNLSVIQADVRQLKKQNFPDLFDVIIINDVLCYLTDYEVDQVLIHLKELLSPNGIIIMNNASLQAFKGDHDLAVGVDKRFSKSLIRKHAKASKLNIVQNRYWPFVLSPTIYMYRSIQRLLRKLHPNRKIHSDVKMPNQVLNSLFWGICRLEMVVLKTGLFGSSLFTVLKKNQEAN
tara:strand:- start:80 stop:871 length:792 start_codon:yes stop_codon:yes gene_type:complete